MRKCSSKRFFATALILVTLFFGLNYSWTHAAFAYALSGEGATCPAELRSDAETRVEELFGDVQSSAILLCLDGPVAGLNIEYGTTRFAPLLRPIVVLGPSGTNVDVAAHEIAHAEFSYWTSVLLRSYKVPTWFDEGLAMQVDLRADYGASALQGYIAARAPEEMTLSDMSRPSLFFQRGEISKHNYAFSRCVVEIWLRENDLANMIDSIGWFSPFPTAQFQDAERHCRTL